MTKFRDSKQTQHAVFRKHSFGLYFRTYCNVTNGLPLNEVVSRCGPWTPIRCSLACNLHSVSSLWAIIFLSISDLTSVSTCPTRITVLPNRNDIWTLRFCIGLDSMKARTRNQRRMKVFTLRHNFCFMLCFFLCYFRYVIFVPVTTASKWQLSFHKFAKHTYLISSKSPTSCCSVIILKRIFEKWDGCMDWIDLAQDRDRQRAVANAVMNLLIPSNGKGGSFLTSWGTVSFSEWLLRCDSSLQKSVLRSDR